jgi:hypothetical protein
MDLNPKKISITIFRNLWKFTGMTSNLFLRPQKNRQDLGFDDQISCTLHNCGFDHGIRTPNEGLIQQNPNVLQGRTRHPAGDIDVQNITNQQEVIRIKLEIFKGPQIWERQRF